MNKTERELETLELLNEIESHIDHTSLDYIIAALESTFERGNLLDNLNAWSESLKAKTERPRKEVKEVT